MALKILTLNVRSLRQNFDQLLILLDNLKTKFDVMTLTETWISKNEANRYLIRDFSMYTQERENKRTGGVVMYVRRNLVCDVTEISESTFGAIKCEIQNNTKEGKNVEIIGIYRYCNINSSKFIPELGNMLGGCKGDVILTGDINIDILDPQSIEYKSFLQLHGYKSYMNEPTRFGLTKNSCIDHVMVKGTNNKNNPLLINSELVNASFTDHQGILTNISWLNSAIKRNNRKTYKFEVNEEKLGTII